MVDEAVSGVRVVKGFGQEDRELAGLTDAAEGLYRSRVRTVRLQARYQSALQAIPALGQVGVLALGGWLAIEGQISIGTFLAFSTYLVQLLAPVRMFAGHGGGRRAGARRHRADLRADRLEPTRHRAARRAAAPGDQRRDHLRARQLRVPALGTGAARLLAPGRAGRDGRARRRLGFGQVDGEPAPPPLLRRAGRQHPDRRRRRARRHPRLGAPRDRHRVRGRVPLLRHRAREHRVRAPRRDRRRRRAGGAHRRCARVRDGAARTATTPWSANAGSRSPAVNASASRSRARCSPTLACSCSTTPRRRSTRAPRSRSTPRCARSWPTARRCSSPTAARPCASPTASCWSTDGRVAESGTHEELLASSPAVPGAAPRSRRRPRGRRGGRTPTATRPTSAASPRRCGTAPPRPRGCARVRRTAGPAVGAQAASGAAARRRAAPAVGSRWLPRRSCWPRSTRCRRPTTSPTSTSPPRPRRASTSGSGAFLRPYRRPLLIGFGLIVIDTLLTLAGPFLVQQGLNEGVQHHATGALWTASVLFLGATLVDWVVTWAYTRYTGRTAERLLFALRIRIFAHLQRLALDYYDREMSGRIMTRMTTDVDAFAQLLQTGLITARRQHPQLRRRAGGAQPVELAAHARRARARAAAPDRHRVVRASLGARVRARPRDDLHRQRRVPGEHLGGARGPGVRAGRAQHRVVPRHRAPLPRRAAAARRCSRRSTSRSSCSSPRAATRSCSGSAARSCTTAPSPPAPSSRSSCTSTSSSHPSSSCRRCSTSGSRRWRR